MTKVPGKDAEPSAAARAARAIPPGRPVRLALLVVASVASAWLMTPGSFTKRMPGDEALGTPAVGTYKAARDHEIPDVDATQQLRDQAVAAERPVYDFDDGAIEEAASRARRAFRAMREGEPRRNGTNATDLARFEVRLGTTVLAEHLQALSQARFSAQAESQVVALAARALAGFVVEDGSGLPADERGIVVRTLRHGVPQGEHSVFDVAIVRDAASARGDVVRAGAALPPDWKPELREAVVAVAASLVRPTLGLNAVETEARRRAAAERVKPVTIRLKRGEKIVGDGEPIERRHLVVFRGIEAETRGGDVLLVRIGGAALIAMLLVLLWRYARRNVRAFTPAPKDAVLLACAFLATLAMAAAGLGVGDALHDRFPRVPPEALYLLVPYAAGAMLVRSVLSAEIALLFALAAGVAVGLLANHSLFLGLQALLTGCAAAGLVARTRDRAGLFKVGLAVGAIGAGLAVASHLFTGGELSDAAWPAFTAACSGALLLPVLGVGLLPLVEWAFGYVTDLKLLELANLNHPALKDLIVQAPGTYHHSVIMGSLVEAAAEEVGANPLLAKVCAYYHDIGKTRNPSWFAENQRGGENRHDQAAPAMSSLVVKRHVTDGMELAQRWKLPKPVADIIPQHHGTRLVSFFWAKALQAAEASDAREPAELDEALYRYAGPKPQTREAALVMIADACEASARAIQEQSPGNLRVLVQRRIHEIFGEGQLDECPLTLKDLGAIATSMARALEAVYHARPEYPGQEPAEAPPPLQLVMKS